MRIVRTLALFALVAVIGVTTARAQVFGSRSSWLAALTGSPTTVTFDGFAPDPSTCAGNCAYGPFSILGAVFDASQAPFIVDNNNDGDPIYDWGTGAVFSPQPFDLNQPNYGIVTLPGVFFAFGIDYGENLNGDGSDGRVDLSNGNSYVLPHSDNWPTLGFWGVVSTTGFNQVLLNNFDGSFAPIYDNASWGDPVPTASVTPEPATMTLMATGLVGMAAAVRRRRKG